MINIINNFKRYKKKFDYKIKKNRKNLSFNHNHFKNLDKNNSYGINVLICAITKQENLYLEEFIEYYVSLGIKKIILYDNNDLDDENINDLLLNKTLFQDFIDIIDYRGIKYAQKKAYNDCYNNNKNKYDWIAFFDIDEFLYLKGFQNINKFLSLSRFKKCSSILIPLKLKIILIYYFLSYLSKCQLIGNIMEITNSFITNQNLLNSDLQRHLNFQKIK